MTRRAGGSDDVLVIGAGLIGLAIAEELSARGAHVRLLEAGEPGNASLAAAGMLAPSVEHAASPDAPPADRERLRLARAFAEASRDGYARFLQRLADRGGRHVTHLANGILEVALTDGDAARLRERADGGGSCWLEASDVARVEPALRHVAGALYHQYDGAVDNVALVEALRWVVRNDRERVTVLDGRATRLERAGQTVIVHLADGTRLEADRVVLAAGAWASSIEGLPRQLPVMPVRGQMLSVALDAIRHVVYGPGGYILPRGGRTLVGATMEPGVATPETTDEAIARVRARGEAILPALRGAPEHARWAGIRPVSPDGQPILGPDPAWPALIYACGHSRNGVLLAPATARAIGRLLLDGDAPELAPFAVDRPALAGATGTP